MLCSSKVVLAIVFSAIGLTARPSEAADGTVPGWYLGADVGRSEIEVDGDADSSSTAFAVHGGYRVTSYLAIEGSYADLGNFGYSVDCQADVCVPEAYPVRFDVSTKRLDVALLGIIPLGERLEAYAKVGIARTEVDTTSRSLLSTSDFSDNSSDPIYGLGVRMNFDAPWALRLQWERIPGVDDSGTDLDALWLGAEYRFGG